MPKKKKKFAIKIKGQVDVPDAVHEIRRANIDFNGGKAVVTCPVFKDQEAADDPTVPHIIAEHHEVTLSEEDQDAIETIVWAALEAQIDTFAAPEE